MNELRLIILGIGIALIAGLYLWEAVKQRKRQRRQTVRHARDETGIRNLAPNLEADPAAISGAIADLNDFLARAKLRDDAPANVQARAEPEDPVGNADSAGQSVPAVDLFLADAVGRDNQANDGANQARGRANAGAGQVISIFIRTPDGRRLTGDFISRAAGEAGMVHGEMEIFHHFGIAHRHGSRPIFSLADMFEPGSFPLQQLAERHTSGLVLFFCLPAPGDARMILELMLNTAERIASSLGAEVLGPHQEPLTDKSIGELRTLVSAQA